MHEAFKGPMHDRDYPPDDSTAVLSECRQWRYTLWRVWNRRARFCQFIGLNPSTADELEDDPTIRRCVNYAKAWGYGGLCMTNLFGWRSTDPNALKSVDDPIGPANLYWLVRIGKHAGGIIAAWGTHGSLREQDTLVTSRLVGAAYDIHCLGKTKDGHPKHPLYLRKDIKPVIYRKWTEVV